MSLRDVVSVQVVQSSLMVSPVGQGTLGTWFPTADGFGVRLPEGDHYVSLQPPRQGKRGQKLNRGGRRRSRAKHETKEWIQRALRAAYVEVAEEIFETPPSVKWLESVFPGMINDALTVAPPWQPKTGREIIDDLRAAAARFDIRKGGGQ